MKPKVYFCIDCGIFIVEDNHDLNPFTAVDCYEIENFTCDDCKNYQSIGLCLGKN